MKYDVCKLFVMDFSVDRRVFLGKIVLFKIENIPMIIRYVIGLLEI